MAIAKEYGRRLTDKSKNLKEDALDTLVSGYPLPQILPLI